MSWGPITATAAPADLKEALEKSKGAYLDQLKSMDYELDAEALQQIDAAIAAGVTMAKTGVAGKVPTANLAGHANPGHQPKARFANDSLYVQLTDSTAVPAAS